MSKKVCCNINIPLDLTLEILKTLPAKSLARFQCVSKHRKSIIRNFLLIDSLVVRSVTQPPRDPHFIVCRHYDYKPYSVFSYTYPRQITNEKHLYDEEIFDERNFEPVFQYVRGLIGFWSYSHGQFTIYNPTTRQSVPLPNTPLLIKTCKCMYYLGYDPLKNHYKVLRLEHTNRKSRKRVFSQVFTLGDPKKEWMNIECGIGYHYSTTVSVYINGAIYYAATLPVSKTHANYVLVSFDVGTHKFDRVRFPDNLPVRDGVLTLINFQGKLAFISLNYSIQSEDVDIWVMENAEKKEWLKITFVAMLKGLNIRLISFVNVTAHLRGEIVSFYERISSRTSVSQVYYYDTKLNIRRRVEIKEATSLERKWLSGRSEICLAVADHVENIMSL